MHEVAQHVGEMIAGGAKRDELPAFVVEEKFTSVLNVEEEMHHVAP
jgi:hypothetical protein